MSTENWVVCEACGKKILRDRTDSHDLYDHALPRIVGLVAEKAAAEAESARLAALLTQTERERDEARRDLAASDKELDAARDRRDHYQRVIHGEFHANEETLGKMFAEIPEAPTLARYTFRLEQRHKEARALLAEAREALGITLAEHDRQYASRHAEAPDPAILGRARALLARLTPQAPESEK